MNFEYIHIFFIQNVINRALKLSKKISLQIFDETTYEISNLSLVVTKENLVLCKKITKKCIRLVFNANLKLKWFLKGQCRLALK